MFRAQVKHLLEQIRNQTCFESHHRPALAQGVVGALNMLIAADLSRGEGVAQAETKWGQTRDKTVQT